MADNLSSIANLTTQEQRARLLKLLAKKELETKLAPLSFSQERFWLEEQINPGSINGLSLSVRIRGQLNVTALEQSFTEIVRRHEVLRTTFVLANDQPWQSIKPAQPLQLPLLSLEDLPATEREAEAQRAVRAVLSRPFDIVYGPLFRMMLLRLGTTDHVLSLNTQHLISDAWSLGILIQELSVLYEAFAQGQPSPLPPLPLQYADFAQWQREKIQDEVLEREIAYWVTQLSGSSGALALPYDRPRPIKRTTLGARESVTLPLSLREQLKALAQQQDSTLFMVLLAGLQVLLYRYTRQANINICTVIANRTINDIEKLIGLFLNTLVLRADLEGNPTFIEVLQQARRTTLEAYDHQTIPFQKMLEALQTQLKFERASLFQVLLTLQNVPNPDIQLSDLSCQRFMREMDFQSDMELTLSLVEAPEGLIGYLQYQTDLFDASTIQRLIRHYQTLLQAVVDNPNQRISEIALLPEVERRQILTNWNETSTDYPQECCIHDLFEAQVALTPEAVAIVFEETHLTYRELNRRANQLAHYLRKNGVRPETLVGLGLERSSDLIVSLLGILKAGGAYVPLDPAYPPERLAFMIQDAGVTVLVTQHLLRQNLPEPATLTICLDQEWGVIARESPENLASTSDAANLAYGMYTSGSTGTPKGIAITHRNVVRLVKNTNYAKLVDQTFLQFAPVSFDASTLEIWGALLNGGRLIIAPAGALSLHDLGQLIETQDLTLVWLTAGLFHLMVDEQLDRLQHCRQVLAGGDVLSVPHVKKARHALGQHGRLINGYGPTENTTFTCCYTLTETELLEHSVPIGRPIANTTVYILDRQLRPVPIGVPGELYTGGDGLARGYLHRPDLTADKFIPHPFSQEPGARLYKTDDLARYLPDGNIEFLGRNDQQVKVRGFRIELGEVESALRQHPALREAVVLTREDRSGNKQLIAYVVLNDEAAGKGGELRPFLQGRLPHYMLPAAFVELMALPLTPNGKLDRRALPIPDFDNDRDDYAPPETPTQEKLIEIWSEVLSVKRVGIHDNFFDLGGHSLLATQIISRLNRIFQLDLPLRSLFEESTVARLGALIEARLLEQQLPNVPTQQPAGAIPRASRRGAIALSFAQQRLWFMEQLAPGSTAYHIPQAVRLIGLVNVPAFERSLNEIVSRHETLRTTFAPGNDQPSQVISPALTLPLPVIDLAALTPPDRETQLRQLMSAEAVRLFDLAQGPLLRVTLIKLAEQEHVLLVVMHHIISDGWSIGIFVREMLTVYTALSAGQPVQLPELPIQYADYAARQRQWLSGEVRQQQLAYWKQQFADEVPALQLPTDHPRPPVQTFRGAKQAFTISPENVAALHAVGRSADATLFMTLLAAFYTLLYRYTGQTDLVVGTPIANRTREEAEGLIGCFVNTLALRVKLANQPSFNDLLKQVREVTLGAYAHQELPFDQLVDELHVQRNLSHAPLFQVLFVLQNAPMPALELPGLRVVPLEMDNQAAQFDLTLSMTEQPQGLLGMVEYNTDLYEAATIQRFIAHFQTLLASIADQPQQRLSDLDLLTESEQRQLLYEWNKPQSPYPQPRCWHERFEAQARQTPDAVALAFEDTQLTYRDLNERADRLACYLQQLGVRSEVAVGVCQARSPELIISILGIWKAGGIYVPLDPALPRARLAFALEDTRATVLLTDSRVPETLSLPELALKIICLDRQWPTIAAAPGGALKGHTDYQQAAYVIYTSGSTGQPKGVIVSHQGVGNVLEEQVAAWQVTGADRVLQFASIGFDASLAELITGLSTGATLCMAARENLLPGPALAHLLCEQNITIATLTPSALAILPEEDFPALRVLNVAGEACPLELMHRWTKRCRFFNLYGPTENTIWSTYTQCASDDSQVTIGRPIAHTQAYILDARLRLAPIGVPGELCVGGSSLARGYLHQADLTAARFIPHPFSTEPGARLYRTGDLARYLPDGRIEFLGRLDQQVKLRGFRIELGEIEATLRQHPTVREAVVVVQQATEHADDKRLVAYLVPHATPPDLNELRRSLLNTLPDYMVPAAFIMLEALPLTTNGKVDRRALPAPDLKRTVVAHMYVAPRTALEEELASIWTDILHLERVGIHDDFFAIGGHSLLATQVMTRITQQFQVTLPLQSLFQSPTIAAIAEKVEMIRWASHSPVTVNESRGAAREEGEL